jgi:hypothetical protein
VFTPESQLLLNWCGAFHQKVRHVFSVVGSKPCAVQKSNKIINNKVATG